MKKPSNFIKYFLLFFVGFTSLVFCGCSDSDEENPVLDVYAQFIDDKDALTADDKNALLFMIEEEKLARDTYTFLGDYWGIQEFVNIKKSEQSHMDAVETLLNFYDIPYEILPYGEFANAEIQNLYDQFVTDGKNSEVAALIIGATIEDLDIIDLQVRIDATTSVNISGVFEKLQCGSENHLRAFVKALGMFGETYTPQFLTQEAYDAILNSNSGGCQ